MTNVLTLRLDPDSQAFFEAMRKKHFPPEQNRIPAHLTLFHTLPDSPEIQEALAQVASAQAAFRIAIPELRSLGKGVAYQVTSGDLLSLHGVLAAKFSEHLTPQDRQRLTPHIVIQNKVTPEAARLLRAELERTFHALEADAVGLDLWHYMGGPWKLAESFSFVQQS